MNEIIFFALLGLATGSLVASLALGLVLSSRGSGTVNLGLGAVATITAYVFYGLRSEGYFLVPALSFGAPLQLASALIISLLFCVALGLLWEFAVGRFIRQTSPLSKMIASLGLLLTLQSIVVIIYGPSGLAAPRVLPEVAQVSVLGQSMPADRLLAAALVLLVAGVLAALYRWSRFGLATRAASENETVALIAGLRPGRLATVNSLISFLLAGLFGVLVAPLTQLDPITMTIAIVPAIAAALIAGFSSFLLAASVGLLLGSIQSLALLASSREWIPMVGGVAVPGVAELVIFIIVVIATLARGRSLPHRGHLSDKSLPAVPSGRINWPVAGIVGAVGLVAMIVLPFDFRQALINSLIGAIVCLSYVVITGYVGQISITQVALAGVAGFTVSKLATDFGIGFPWSALAGVLVATLVGVLIGISALRVRGLSLAIVTIAAAVALEDFGFDNTVWGAGQTGSPVPSPVLFGIDLGPSGPFPFSDGTIPSPTFGIVCLAVLAFLGVTVLRLRGSSLGMRFLAVRSNERAAASSGIDVRLTKLIAFTIASAIAGVAGVLYGYNFGAVTASRFGIMTGLGFVAFAYLGGITRVSGAVVGGLLATGGVLSQVFESAFGLAGTWATLIGGLLLLVTIVANPEGIAGAATQSLSRLRRRRSPETWTGAERAGVV